MKNFIKSPLQIIVRGKEKLEELPCEQFLQGFEISRSFVRAKQVGQKRAKIQNPVKIAHKAFVLIFISLYTLVENCSLTQRQLYLLLYLQISEGYFSLWRHLAAFFLGLY